MKTTAIYVRVSTEEQKAQGLSVDNQIDALVQFCKDNKMKYKIYNDAGISAHKSYKKRTALLRLIEDCQNGEIGLIVFTRIDRWFRSIKDYYLVQDQLNGVPWKAIWEDYEIETSSGQLKVNIMLSVAEAEASRTSEKIKSVLEYKKEKGEHVGQVPFGFKLENKKLVKDEITEEACKQMFNKYLVTCSIEKTYEEIKGTSAECSRVQIRNRLKNRQYVGHYITAEEFDFVQSQFRKNLRPSRNKHVHLFVGLMPCPICGKSMSQRDKYDGGKVTYTYRCYNKCYNIGEKTVEKQLISFLDKIIGSTEIKAEIEEFDKQNKDIEAIKKKIERLKDLYIDGDILKDEYNRRKEALEEQKSILEHSKKAVLPTLPNNWKEVYNDLSREGKRAFWSRILHHIDISDKASIKAVFR